MIKSLHARKHPYADTTHQVEVLEQGIFAFGELPRFENRLRENGCYPLTPSETQILQVNVGYMCNQTCKHCHVHCYRPGHREKVREIMRFSGRHLILRGRLDLLWHYFF